MAPAELSYSKEAVVAMLLFSVASSSLLLINKLCLHYMPVPAFISTAQFLSATITSIVRSLFYTSRPPCFALSLLSLSLARLLFFVLRLSSLCSHTACPHFF